MLSTILTNLQTLISPSFVVANFFPTLVFWLMNAGMVYLFSPRFRDVILQLYAKGGIENSMWGVIFLIGTAMTAYVLSALIPRTQALMEGKWWDWAVHLFAPNQGRRLAEIDDRIQETAKYRTELESQSKDWQWLLQGAADFGNKHHTGHQNFGLHHPAAKAVSELIAGRNANKRLNLNALKKAVLLLGNELATNDYAAPLPDGTHPLELTFLHLDQLLRDTQTRAVHEHIRLVTQRHFSYGTQNLAPTRMGNIANTVQSYAINRYNLNLEVFWSRLQHSLGADKDFNSKLETVRTKLEFLIGSSLLTAVWGLVWACVLLKWGYDWPEFVAISVGGPLAAYLWYLIATEHYRTYADVLRSSIDLFRLGLLRDLHLPLPADVVDERELWDQLNELTDYYDITNFHFEHPKTS